MCPTSRLVPVSRQPAPIAAPATSSAANVRVRIMLEPLVDFRSYGNVRATCGVTRYQRVAAIGVSSIVIFCDDISVISGRVGAADAVALHLGVEQLPVDVELTRRLGAVAGRCVERATDHAFFELGDGRRQIAGSRQPFAVLHAVRVLIEVEVTGCYHGTAGQHASALDHVPKFTHVAWP